MRFLRVGSWGRVSRVWGSGFWGFGDWDVGAVWVAGLDADVGFRE